MESRPKGTTAASEGIYEDIEPSMEWAREAALDTLLISLPGFRKEQLRVQVTATGNLRISGDRQVTDNRWNRFRKELPISSNHDPNGISANFDKGVLYVKLPKIIVPAKVLAQDQEEQKEHTPIQTQKPDKDPQFPTEPEKPSQEKEQQLMTEDSRSEMTKLGQPKVSTDKLNDALIHGGTGDHNVPQKAVWEVDKKQRKYEGKETSNEQLPEEKDKAVTEASASIEPNNLKGTAKMDKDKAAAVGIVTGIDGFRKGHFNYKQVLSGLVVAVKKPGKLINLLLVVLALVVLGLYVMNAIRSLQNQGTI